MAPKQAGYQGSLLDYDDRAILGSIVTNERQLQPSTYRGIAKDTGLSHNKVWRRCARMRERGILSPAKNTRIPAGTTQLANDVLMDSLGNVWKFRMIEDRKEDGDAER